MNPQTHDNEVAYSPLRINLILHCYARADWIENEQAPAVQEELNRLMISGILEPQAMPPHYKLTPKGLEFVKTLLATPLSARLAPAPEAQEEMPLEDDLKDLKEIAKSNLARFTENAIAEKTANSIRYLLQQINTLRDEIEKLKKQ